MKPTPRMKYIYHFIWKVNELYRIAKELFVLLYTCVFVFISVGVNSQVYLHFNL